MGQPNFWGVRHLSPAGAYHLLHYLDEIKPRLVLVEGPSDFNSQLKNITMPETQPPIAILAYTSEAPVRTILYPFAEYSPEYQAIMWCHKNKVECRFMDLPSEVFLALSANAEAKANEDFNGDDNVDDIEESHSDEGEEGRAGVYRRLDEISGEDGGSETFWERVIERSADSEAYREGAYEFGRQLRELTEGVDSDWEETKLREAYMRRKISDAVAGGIEPERIVVVTGAYHVEGLRDYCSCMSDADIAKLPRLEANHTLMPYSYYRLSSRSGYGAGNRAPAYYELLWESLCRKEPHFAAYSYLSRIAGYQRSTGNPVSSADVIEAVRLADSLAGMHDSKIPALRDIRDAAITCIGGGSLAAINLAVADTEIGTRIGSLPDGVSRTSIQEDFYRLLKDLKLERYRDISAQDLSLDLRENRNVKSERAAFLDLYRSFFLNQLSVLGVSFAKKQATKQDNATWAENWVLRWSPEAEIELVEAALKGDTIAQAASFCMKERVEAAPNMGEIARVIEEAFDCGMAGAVSYATSALQAMSVDAASVEELANTVQRLSVVVQYGNIRRLDSSPLIPIMTRMFYRACLLLPGACVCDDGGARVIIGAIEKLNSAALAHDVLDQEAWISALDETAYRDDLNTKLSGFAAAILLERGVMDSSRLKLEVQRRLSKGVPADLGAGWFEGLAMKNRYALIARLSLWENLDAYLAGLDDEEFKRALVFLRRAFADFTSQEKDEIAENLGEIWGLNGQQVSETVNAVLDDAESQMVESLDDFDFDL
ncbi:MAG: hypothetical protein HFE63_00245 [Clostridiales bacterium]|nr:hypothetical protein [Clostridiales bacterium]